MFYMNLGVDGDLLLHLGVRHVVPPNNLRRILIGNFTLFIYVLEGVRWSSMVRGATHLVKIAILGELG